ncbi:Fatty acid 2-hydroxylase [Anthophora plagiata]
MASAADFAYDVCKKRSQHNEKETEKNSFLIKYQERFYNIKGFLRYHPGGKKTLGHFKNRSLDEVFENNPHSKAAFHLLEDFTLNNQEKYQEYEAPFDDRRLVFPPVPGLLVATLLWYIYKMLFPQTMFNFIAAGTVTGFGISSKLWDYAFGTGINLRQLTKPIEW